MDAVDLVSCAIGRCVDTCCLLVDLVVWIVGWLLRFLSGMGCSLHGLLVALSGSTLVEYWNLALFSFLTVTEVVSSVAQGALLALEGWLQTLGGVCESFKMVGHLTCHVAWRTKELLHRGLVSGNYILRQTCEGVCIALSLVLYFVNTVINILLIGMQNCFSALAGAWEAVAGPLHKAVELALTLLTFLYSCLVGASVLLWAPCQLLLDFLGALGRVFITVFVVDAHGLLTMALIVSLALLYLNPRLPLLIGRQSLRCVSMLPGVRGVQTALRWLHTALLERQVHARRPRDVGRTRRPQEADRTRRPQEASGTRRPQEADRTRRPQESSGTRRPQEADGTRRPQEADGTRRPQEADGTRRPQEADGTRRPQEADGTRRPQEMDGTRRPQEADGTRLPNAERRASGASVNLTDTHLPPANDPSQLDIPHLEGEPQSSGDPRDNASSSAEKDGGGPPQDGNLLSLLKEQEERKKCVICQDWAKTVLLLPCRHLCLCRHCADILTERQPLQQRCCPLCRQPITQTMDVFL
ncbi:E3 ubiquitin-protein ligase RNF26-like [Diretmus argenteus]